jgi:NADH-quinone oxidoreductase subunit L
VAGDFRFSAFFRILFQRRNSVQHVCNESLPDPAGKVLWAIGAVTALLTAIYMTRLMVLTFQGDERFKKEPETQKAGHDSHNGNGHHHAITPHESPLSMTVPLMILAVGALSVGWLGIPNAFGGSNQFEHFLEPVVATAPAYGSHVATESSHAATAGEHAASEEAGEKTEELALTGVSVVIALLGLGIGWVWFSKKPLWQPPSILENKYYVDEIYDVTVVNPIKTASTSFLWRFFDVLVIDGFVNYFATIIKDMGSTLRMIQTGATRNYAAIIALGAVVIIGYIGLHYIW